MNTVLIIVAIMLFIAVCSVLRPERKNVDQKYVPGTGKMFIHKQGWTYLDLKCNGGSSHSAMDIVNQHRGLSDYAKVLFARTVGVTKTKDFVRDGQDEYTYMIECWDT